MRTRYDQFGKQMVCVALERHGAVVTDAEVTAETRRIDLWFMPDHGRSPRPEHLGMLGRITNGPSTLEFFHNTPSGDELAACLIKHGEFRHVLSLRKAELPVPTQSVISSGRPDTGIDGLWLRPVTGWPSGIYEGPPLLWTRLVVVNELPTSRDTLLLRLLGAGAVLKRAIAELERLPDEAPERTLAQPVLLRLRLAVPSDPAKQTTDDKEFLMDTEDIVQVWERKVMQRGMQQGLERGVQEGMQQGLERGVQEGLERGARRGLAQGLVMVYAARFGAMAEDLRAIVEATEDEGVLAGWMALVGTQSAEDIAAAIRAARAS